MDFRWRILILRGILTEEVLEQGAGHSFPADKFWESWRCTEPPIFSPSFEVHSPARFGVVLVEMLPHSLAPDRKSQLALTLVSLGKGQLGQIVTIELF